jgi:hypothetical protein
VTAGLCAVFDELDKSEETFFLEGKLKFGQWCPTRGKRRPARLIVGRVIRHQCTSSRNSESKGTRAIDQTVAVDKGNEGTETVKVFHCFGNVVRDSYLVTRAAELLRDALEQSRV